MSHSKWPQDANTAGQHLENVGEAVKTGEQSPSGNQIKSGKTKQWTPQVCQLFYMFYHVTDLKYFWNKGWEQN